MAACALDFYVNRESDGSLQKSILFDDLRKLTNQDRALAKKYYFLGTSEEFLNEFGKDARFDENGEITVGSLIKLAKLDIREDKILKMLNDEIGAGINDYNNVIYALQNFNRTNRFNDEFMATIVRTQDGRYDLQVVKRTKRNEDALNDVIMKQSLMNRILYRLREKGVNVEFIERDNRERGRYSTENAMQTADGLWSLIRIARGERITPTLAQEAGHFAVGALGNDPLVQRLEEALTPEVMAELVSQDDMTVLGNNPQREVMGRLVGDAIMEDIDSRNPLYKLAKRIWNKAKRMFFTFVEDNVQLMVMDAKASAEQIAKGFMSPDFTGSVENALNMKELLFDADLSESTAAFKEITNSLKLMTAQMKNIFGSQNRGAYKSYLKLAPDAELGFNITDTDADHQVVDRIAGIIEDLEQLMINEIPELLAGVDIDDVRFMEHVPMYAKKLRAVHTFCNTIIHINNIINSLAKDSTLKTELRQLNNVNPSLATVTNPEGRASIEGLMNNLAQRVTDQLLGRCKDKEYAVFLKFMQTFYGKDYIDRSARIVFDFDKRKPGEARKPLLKRLKAEKVSLNQLLRTLDNDISYVDRFLTSMANNPDVIGGITDKIAKFANKRADDATNYVWDELRRLEKSLRSGELGTDNTRMFCEVDDDGNITGNYLSKVRFWEWEEKYNEFVRKSRIEFYVKVFETTYNTTMPPAQRAQYDNQLNDSKLNDTQKMYLKRDFGRRITQTWPSEYRAEQWDEFMHKARKTFHENNSEKVEVTDPVSGKPIYDADGNVMEMYVPSDEKYHSSQWDAVMENPKIPENVRKARLAFYNKLMQLKMECDDCLPVNANRVYRMPMFRGTFMERMKNRMKTGQKGGATFVGAMASNMRENIINTFTINSDDNEFGSTQTYNTENDTEDNLFGDALRAQLDNINRVPFFGINKLRDRNLKRLQQIRRYEREIENGDFSHKEELKKLRRMGVNEVSTDLLQSMLAYASMAHTYAAMNSIVDVMEVGKEVLVARDANSVGFRPSRRKESYALQRYSSYIEKQVYGIGVMAPKWDRYGLARKLVQGFSGLASKIFLGGNLAGGIVNTGTGAIELFKESVAGEFWTTKEFWQAYNIYRKSAFDSLIHPGAEFKQDDVSLIIRHFNVLGDIKQKHRDWDTSNRFAMRLGNLLQGSAWAPYHTGEHFMQSMAYIIALLHNHVIDGNGNRISLMDMYKQNIVTEDINGKKMKRIRWDKHGRGFEDEVTTDNEGNETGRNRFVYYNDYIDDKTGKTAREVSLIAESIMGKLKGQTELDPSERMDLWSILTNEEKDLLDKYQLDYRDVGQNGELLDKMDVSRYDDLVKQLDDINRKTQWTSRNESDLMDQCREINNRLHGIYNKQDKVGWQQTIIGNMMLTMRGYALGMAQRRFTSDRFNVATDSDFEGSVVTFAKALVSMFSFPIDGIERMDKKQRRAAKFRAFSTGLRAILFPYNIRKSNIKQKMLDLGWSEQQFANLRRNNMDLMIILGLTLLKALSAADIGAGEDEDIKKKIAELKERKKNGLFVREGAIESLEKQKKALKDKKDKADDERFMGLLHYFTARWLREQSAFNTPGGINQEGNQLIELPAGWSIVSELANTAYLGAGAMFADKTNSNFFYQKNDNAGDRYKQYDSKFFQQIMRYFPYYRSYKFVWRRPYQALASYEYNMDK